MSHFIQSAAAPAKTTMRLVDLLVCGRQKVLASLPAGPTTSAWAPLARRRRGAATSEGDSCLILGLATLLFSSLSPLFAPSNINIRRPGSQPGGQTRRQPHRQTDRQTDSRPPCESPEGNLVVSNSAGLCLVWLNSRGSIDVPAVFSDSLDFRTPTQRLVVVARRPLVLI